MITKAVAVAVTVVSEGDPTGRKAAGDAAAKKSVRAAGDVVRKRNGKAAGDMAPKRRGRIAGDVVRKKNGRIAGDVVRKRSGKAAGDVALKKSVRAAENGSATKIVPVKCVMFVWMAVRRECHFPFPKGKRRNKRLVRNENRNRI